MSYISSLQASKRAASVVRGVSWSYSQARQLRLRCFLRVVLGKLGDKALQHRHRQHVACGRAHTQQYRMSARHAIRVESMRHAYAYDAYACAFACGLARRAGEALCGVHLVSLCVLPPGGPGDNFDSVDRVA